MRIQVPNTCRLKQHEVEKVVLAQKIYLSLTEFINLKE
jgi:hypothetical protein